MAGMTNFRPKIYAKLGCPFSFRIVLFFTEAQLLDEVEVIQCDPAAADYEAVRAQLEAATGAAASFPTVEVEPGVFRSESAELIEAFAQQHGRSVDDMPVLDFYTRGVYASLIRLFRENGELRNQLQA